MKIGILTYHRAVNYGAFLQSYSLCTALNQQPGIEAEVIDYSMQSAWNYYDVGSWKLKKKLKSFGQLGYRKKQNAAFAKAVEENKGVYSKETLVSDDIEEFRRFVGSHYDVIIVGSDEVWKVNQMRGFPNPYFLPGDFGCRKFSYAASFGKSVSMTGEKEEKLREFLKDFEVLSVRDRIAYDYISGNQIGGHAMISCDPSFLYDFRKELGRTENPLTNGSVKLDKNKKTIAVMVDERSAGILPGKLGDRYNLVSLYRKWNGYINVMDVDPFGWLKILSEADFVISSYFHGVCFSICNNTPVLAIGSKGKQHKLGDLLQNTGLERCYILGDQLEKEDLPARIEEISHDTGGYQKFVDHKRSGFEEYVQLLRKDA